jgi:hypothetical protein
MYYYLELLQQRRICNAATNNDGRSQTMVDLHEWLMVHCSAYQERCCFTTPPLYVEEEEQLDQPDHAVIFQWYQPDTQDGPPAIDGFILLGSGEEEESSAAHLTKVTLRVSSTRQVCSMFSLARRGLEKAASNENDPVLQEEGMNEARVALLNALRRAERILVNRDDDVDHRIPKTTVAAEDLVVPCDDATITFLESCFNIDSGAIGEHKEASKWFRDTLL